MATKVLTQNAAELLLSGQTTLVCPACGTSNWSKANLGAQTKKPGMLTVRCKTCANAASKKSCAYPVRREARLAGMKERYATDQVYQESMLAKSNARYATDPVYREAMLARNKKRRETDPAYRVYMNEHSLQWAKDNPGKHNARCAKRRATKLQATPAWADLSAIQAFYEACPEGHHVDHIVPLQGREVCGLHVLDNLQYLPATENLSKGNKFNEQEEKGLQQPKDIA